MAQEKALFKNFSQKKWFRCDLFLLHLSVTERIVQLTLQILINQTWFMALLTTTTITSAM